MSESPSLVAHLSPGRLAHPFQASPEHSVSQQGDYSGGEVAAEVPGPLSPSDWGWHLEREVQEAGDLGAEHLEREVQEQEIRTEIGSTGITA